MTQPLRDDFERSDYDDSDPLRIGPEALPTVPADVFCAVDAGPIDYLARPLVVRGGFTVVYGPPKIGKTTLVAHMVNAMLDPTWAFLDGTGRIASALWLDLEQPRRVSQRRFAETGANHWLHVYRGVPPKLPHLLATIDELHFDLLIADSLPRWLLLDNENDSAEVNRKLSPILLALQERDVTLVTIAHAGKADGPTGRTLRGASAFLAAVDIAVEIKAEGPPIDGRRRLCFTSREELTQDLIVRLDAGRFILEGSAKSVAFHAHAADVEKAIRFGHNRKETMAQYLKVSSKTVEQWVAPLIADGTVRATKASTRGAPVVYSLPSSGSAQNLLGISENG